MPKKDRLCAIHALETAALRQAEESFNCLLTSDEANTFGKIS